VRTAAGDAGEIDAQLARDLEALIRKLRG